MRLKLLDGCACPRKLYPVLDEAKHRAGLAHVTVFESLYRGDGAEHLLNSVGKHTQRQLWEASPAQRAKWGVLGTPNPPRHSTHELYSDGVAYPSIPSGHKIEEVWKLGLDVKVEYLAKITAALHQLGGQPFHPYRSGAELHHINLGAKPKLRLRDKAKRGGRKLKKLVTGGIGPKHPKVAPEPKPAPKPVRKPDPRVMFDSITISEIPNNPQAVAGYTSGYWPTFRALVKRFPHARHVSIAVTASHDADCLDVEAGDASPDQAPAWVCRQHSRGAKRPIIYTSASQVRTVEGYLARAGIKRSQYRLWSAHYTGHPHICTPKACGYPAADATQWTSRSHGRNLDESLCGPHFWH